MFVTEVNLICRINCSLFFSSAVSEIWSQYKRQALESRGWLPHPHCQRANQQLNQDTDKPVCCMLAHIQQLPVVNTQVSGLSTNQLHAPTSPSSRVRGLRAALFLHAVSKSVTTKTFTASARPSNVLHSKHPHFARVARLSQNTQCAHTRAENKRLFSHKPIF